LAERYDAIVVGAGPAGEHAIGRLQKRGLRCALVERELVGGECAYWACIPSKTLLRAPEVRLEARRAAGVDEPEQRWRDLAEYRDYMIRNLDDSKEVESYRDGGVHVHKGEARIAGPGRVVVGDETLETERIIVATGSSARVPEIPGLGDVGYWTNREATTLDAVPQSIIVLGGGPVGVELGQFMRRFGAEVTVVEKHDRVLAREDAAVSELLGQTLSEEGIELRLGTGVERVTRDGSDRVVHLGGGETVKARELLVAIGREPRVPEGLEALGVEVGGRGIRVDERCQAGEGVWAIGDVTGVMPFTHVGKYQARIACADIAGESARADYGAIPRVVFSDPEVAAVGITEAQAREQGIDTLTARVELADAIARPWTYERDPRGSVGLVADRGRDVLVGAWAVAPLASEWIHYAALAIKTQTPLAVLRDTVAQFPTFTEGYLNALEQLS
jgi:pyruvate/2-oxoglutarate dehydrogenase complex dihydrolipoamide dehydrogenase (E3) component